MEGVPAEPSPLTHSLLALKVRPGAWTIELSASWCNETERGTMSPAAAAFWSDCGRADLLRPGGFAVEWSEWDEDQHGPLPQPGSPERDVESDLEYGECRCVREGIEIVFPQAMFEDPAKDPSLSEICSHDSKGLVLALDELTSWEIERAAAAAVLAARQRLSWAAACIELSEAHLLSFDLIEQVAMEHRAHCEHESSQKKCLTIHEPAAAEDFFFPDPQPCTWEYTVGWKGSYGSVEVEVKEDELTTLGEFLQRRLSGDVGARYNFSRLSCSYGQNSVVVLVSTAHRRIPTDTSALYGLHRMLARGLVV